MASIQKRIRNNRTSYRVRYRDPSGKPRSKSFRRLVDAERFARTVEIEKEKGTWVDPKAGRITLDEWREQFVKTELGNRASTRARDQPTHSPDAMNESTRDLRVGEGRAMRRSWVFSAAWCQQ